MRLAEAAVLALAIGGAAYVVAKSSEGKSGGGGSLIPIPIEKPVPIQVPGMPALNIQFPKIEFPKFEMPAINITPEVSFPTTPENFQLRGILDYVNSIRQQYENQIKELQDKIAKGPKLTTKTTTLPNPTEYVKKFGEGFIGPFIPNFPPPEEAGKRTAEGFMKLLDVFNAWRPTVRIVKSPEDLHNHPVDKAIKNAFQGAANYVGKAFDGFVKSFGKKKSKRIEPKPSELLSVRKFGIPGVGGRI
ncbi:hypothetical protein [Archaeoglobus veneficus]|uniref:Uncharacterized protein n=1 Tax=Archaeoglobus veneficus (strain DSM 11195 / SNP6) TaxID=693661 RepID=F2KSJ1_ARCVS|nr:hypothetical protein [Archaeoglobus veneficus]AEA48061.1 hypothetical protein Arcve_2071 [Archaeoglobus veneficus SNP6]